MKSLKHYMNKRKYRHVLYFLLFTLAIIFLAFKINFDIITLYRGIPNMMNLFQRMLRPNPSYIREVLGKLLETIEIAVISSLTGVFLAIPISLLVAENIAPNKFLASVLRSMFAFIRTIPSLIWAAVLVSIFSIGKFSGIISLAIIAFLMSLKLFREYIEAIEENQLNAIRTVGGSSIQVLKYCVLPHIYELSISVFFTVFETNIRSATILGLVGAGGIGQIMWRDLNHLRYDNLSTLILILFSTILLIDLLSLYIRRLVAQRSINYKDLDSYRKVKKYKLIVSPIFLFSIFTLIQKSLDISYDRFLLGIEQGYVIVSRMVKIDISYVYRLMEGIQESLYIAIFATIVGAVFSLIFSYLAAYNTSPKPWLSLFFKGIVNIFRTFPPIITAIIFFRGVGPGPLSGALALSIYTIGVLTKMYSEVLESTSQDIQNSVITTGATKFQSYRHGLIPHTFPTFISLALYRLESNIRNSTILGIIGAGGIGTILSMNITWRNWEKVGILLLGTSIMVIAIDKISNYLRKVFS